MLTETKERPILFSGPMVRAILEGRKTMTRRVVKRPEYYGCLTGDCPHDYQTECDEVMPKHCPYGKPGDRLWVRETFAKVPNTAGCEKYAEGFDPTRSAMEQYRSNAVTDPYGYRYRATWDRSHTGSWKPSIHMPRWASRILLEVVSVRVERLQDISEDDAQAEGITFDGSYWRGGPHRIKGTPKCMTSPVSAFHDLWDSINDKRGHGWESNPWVWVVEFKRVEGVTA